VRQRLLNLARAQWNAFVNKNGLYVPATSLQEVVTDIQRFVLPLITADDDHHDHDDVLRRWTLPAGGPWAKNRIKRG
jgi:hypothetical protein